ncbi:transposase [Brachybacterium sp. UMB0905]|uniref:transposase n=1 Tax=Brachybacterium sp. UMB0905 TaxID=2069310 RepID=UPI0013040C5B|nr:transposase [Brachybacterium sp. UMB0905]
MQQSLRRVKRLGQAPAGQEGLFETYRYHCFITNSTLTTVEADRTHRHHAVIEQVIAELKDRPLAHLPSGKFTANQAWLSIAVMAFNLSRATAHAAGMARARIPTIRKRLISLPGRIAHRARRLVLHLPEARPWQHQWTRLWNTATSPPPATAS